MNFSNIFSTWDCLFRNCAFSGVPNFLDMFMSWETLRLVFALVAGVSLGAFVIRKLLDFIGSVSKYV